MPECRRSGHTGLSFADGGCALPDACVFRPGLKDWDIRVRALPECKQIPIPLLSLSGRPPIPTRGPIAPRPARDLRKPSVQFTHLPIHRALQALNRHDHSCAVGLLKPAPERTAARPGPAANRSSQYQRSRVICWAGAMPPRFVDHASCWSRTILLLPRYLRVFYGNRQRHGSPCGARG